MPKKNIRPLAGRPFGLLQLKLEQLLGAKRIDHIILSTNDEVIIDYAQGLRNAKLEVRLRDDALAANSTSTDALIDFVGSQVDEGHILWTHVTSPFVTATDYDAMIEEYLTQLKRGYDSLMSVTEVRGFLWDNSGPVNYDRRVEKWPRTQTLAPLYEVNSAAFLAPADVYRARKDRIGEKPYKFVLDKIQGFDVDWEPDFLIAEALLSAGVTEV